MPLINTDEADRISDRIVGIFNKELEATDNPLDVLAGGCLGMMALLRSGPPGERPAVMDGLGFALSACLADLLHSEVEA